MNDAEFEQLRLDQAELLQRIAALQDVADEQGRRINEELERRRNHPGADVREFRPRQNGPTDQGSC